MVEGQAAAEEKEAQPMTKDREDLVKASAMTRLLAENQRLRAALESLRRRHELHDNWESCPLAIGAPGPDYRDRYGDRPAEPRRCTCGADEANTIIDEALNGYPQQQHNDDGDRYAPS